jgi:transcription elongation factor Elf1
MGSYSGSPECPKCGQKEGVNTEDDFYYKTDEYYFRCWECGYGYSRDTVDWKSDPPKPLPEPVESEWYGARVRCLDCGNGMSHATSWSADMTQFHGDVYTCFVCRTRTQIDPQGEPLKIEPPLIPDDESDWVACEGRCNMIWMRESERDENGLECGECRADYE